MIKLGGINYKTIEEAAPHFATADFISIDDEAEITELPPIPYATFVLFDNLPNLEVLPDMHLVETILISDLPKIKALPTMPRLKKIWSPESHLYFRRLDSFPETDELWLKILPNLKKA